MDELIYMVEQWFVDRNLDEVDSNKKFKVVEGFPNHVITNEGRLFVVSYVDLNGGTRKAREIKQLINKDGYPTVRLTHRGKNITTRVHRLVANAFIPNPENKETVNHIDGNKQNNNVSNLEWSNRSEQLYHAYENGLKKSTTVGKLMTKISNGIPVKCIKKESGEVIYFLSARDCSRELGYSNRWCDKTISEMNGETKKFNLEYVSLEEVKANSDKVSFSTLIKLIELWSIDKGLHKVDSSKQALKFFEEAGETAAALARSDMDELKDGVGDVIVTLIILAQQNNLTLEECLEHAYNEIKNRKGEMKNGVFVKQEDL